MALLERPFVRLAVVAALLAIAGLGFLLLRATAEPDPRVIDARSGPLGALDTHPPVIGKPAPDFALRQADGDVVRLSDLRGSVVWLNFWATWCAPCKRELPDIQKIYDERGGDDLEVLAINYQEDGERANGFFGERDLTIPLLLDTTGDVYAQYRLQGLPANFFVDRDGNIAAVQFGFLTEEAMRERLEAAGL